MTTTPMPVTYSLWLNQQRHRDDPVGDLAREVAYDPYQVTTPTALAWHIRHEGASEAALEAAQRAGTEWAAAHPAHDDTPIKETP